MASTATNSIVRFGVLFNGFRIFTGAFSILYMIEAGLTVSDIGFVKAFQVFVILFSDIPLGYIADKRSKKASVLLAALCCSLWLVVMGMAENIWHFLIAEFFNALSMTFIGGAFNAMLLEAARSDGSKTSRTLAVNHKWNHLGMFFFSLVGALIADLVGVAVWFIAATCMVLTFAYGLLVLPSSTPVENSENSSILADIQSVWKAFMKTKIAVVSFVSGVIIFNIIAQFWQVYFDDPNFEISRLELGIVFSLILLSQSLSSLLYEKLSHSTACGVSICVTVVACLSYFYLFEINKFGAAIVGISLFFSVRTLMLVVETALHENISDSLRSTCESTLSTLARVLLLGLFPFVGWYVQMYGVESFTVVTFSILAVGLMLNTLRRPVNDATTAM